MHETQSSIYKIFKIFADCTLLVNRAKTNVIGFAKTRKN